MAIFLVSVAICGCAATARYDAKHPANQLGREVRVHGVFSGPGVQADYVTTNGAPVYLDGDFFKNVGRPAYGSEVEVRGVLKFKRFTPGDYQHPPDYYYIDRGSLKIVSPADG